MPIYPPKPTSTGKAVMSPLSANSTGSPAASVAITSVPTTGTVGTALSLAGTVSPSGTAVRVGLSASATTAPTSWTTATVNGGAWTASLAPTAAGTFYLWVEQTGTTSVQAVSAAITVSAAGGAALTYSYIAGSGTGAVSGLTMSTNSNAVDWTSAIAKGATDVVPAANIGSQGTIASCKFWWDTTATGTTVGASFGNQAGFPGGSYVTFYADSAFAPPTGAPPAPSTAGTYYGKYAFYDSSSNLLGVFTTSAITVS